VVTGGAQGIGLAMARRFAAAGMNLVLADHDATALECAVAEVAAAGRGPDGVLAVEADAARPQDLQSVCEQALSRFGSTDLLLSNAGVALPAMPLWELTPEVWQWISGINISGSMNAVAAFVPGMVQRGLGHVVITASTAGLQAAASLGGYAVTKHALVGLARALRADLAGTGVGVSVLCPGRVPTNLKDSTARFWPADAARPENLNEPRPGAQVPGLPAETVAELVHDAVLERRFWIMSHPEVLAAVAAGQRELAADADAAATWLAGHAR
jgi:NAD(P)-dependent dehydrogenase (short-subunit alcohol dehydrogenase family)